MTGTAAYRGAALDKDVADGARCAGALFDFLASELWRWADNTRVAVDEA